jgi:hypothetical protein
MQINRYCVLTSCYLVLIFSSIRDLRLFRILRSVRWQFRTDVSGLTTIPTFKGRNLLTLEQGYDILSQNIGKELPLYAVQYARRV